MADVTDRGIPDPREDRTVDTHYHHKMYDGPNECLDCKNHPDNNLKGTIVDQLKNDPKIGKFFGGKD